MLCFYWCRHQESNPGPTDYKSVALPAELCRRNLFGRALFVLAALKARQDRTILQSGQLDTSRIRTFSSP